MGRKPKEWQREPGWWSENFFAIRDLIWAIYFKVEEPDKAAGPSLDTLFRRLRARIDTFEAKCRRKTTGRAPLENAPASWPARSQRRKNERVELQR